MRKATGVTTFAATSMYHVAAGILSVPIPSSPSTKRNAKGASPAYITAHPRQRIVSVQPTGGICGSTAIAACHGPATILPGANARLSHAPRAQACHTLSFIVV